MFVITEWLVRYEVNEKGQPAKPGDKLRVSPLDYIRSKVHGRSEGAGFAKLHAVAEDKCYEVFGIFQKFLEIAGSEKGGERGVLLNEKGKPATTLDLAFLLRFPFEKVQYAIQILMDERVAWIQEVPDESFQKFQENQEGGNSGTKQDGFPEIPGIPGAFINRTEPNRIEPNTNQPNTTEGILEGKNSQRNSQDVSKGKSIEDDFGLGNFNSTSFRFRLVTALESLLKARSSSDRKSLQNLVNWLHLQLVARRFDENIFREVLEIAKDSKNGSRKPMAVFFKNLDDRIGYRANVAKQLRENL
jgi:hypothetical protein